MFWIPYLRSQSPGYTAGCSPDPAYDKGFFGSQTDLWTVTYPQPTAVAWAIVEFMNSRLKRSRFSKWSITHGVRQLLRELDLPAKVRLAKVDSPSSEPLFEPPPLDERVLMGRVLTLREVAAASVRRGYPIPPGFEHGLQEAILSGRIRVRPGIRLVPGRRPTCNRCGSQRITSTFCAHCGSDSCLVCEDCGSIGLIRGCTPLFTSQARPQVSVVKWPALATPLQLTPGQEGLVNQLVQELRPGGSNCLVDSVCGSGKGYMLLELLRRLLRDYGGQRILISTPRRSVIDEWAEKFSQVLGEQNLSVVGGGQQVFRPGAAVTLATLPQLYRFSRLFDLVLIDEADAFPLGRDFTYWGVIKRVMVEDQSRMVLFTATPQALPGFCQDFVRLSLPVRYHGKPLPEPVIEVAKSKQQMLECVKNHLDQWLKIDQMRVYIFVPTKIIGKEVFSYLSKNGYCENIGDLLFAGLADFQEKLDCFRSGQSPIAIATTVLERGLTVSPCSVLVFWADHPNFQESSLVQMAGRSGRSAGYSKGAVVFVCQKGNAAAPENAIRHIRQANAEAERKGFLK